MMDVGRMLQACSCQGQRAWTGSGAIDTDPTSGLELSVALRVKHREMSNCVDGGSTPEGEGGWDGLYSVL